MSLDIDINDPDLFVCQLCGYDWTKYATTNDLERQKKELDEEFSDGYLRIFQLEKALSALIQQYKNTCSFYGWDYSENVPYINAVSILGEEATDEQDDVV